MVRVLIDEKLTTGGLYIEAAGLSTDTKPTENIVTGSRFREVDTGKTYLFAEGDSPTWYENELVEIYG